jgi:hypothetical protein
LDAPAASGASRASESLAWSISDSIVPSIFDVETEYVIQSFSSGFDR